MTSPAFNRSCHRQILTASIFISLLLQCSAWADVVFNNFGSGDTFNFSSGYSETGLAPGQSLGEGFTPAFSGNLSVITIAMSHSSGSNDVHLFLASGTGGIPGTILESWIVPNLSSAGISYSPLKLDSISQPLLSAGHLYFLYSQEPGNELDLWNLNSISEQGPYFIRQNSGELSSGTHTQGAFRVEVAPIPEPGISSFAAVAASIALWRRCRTRTGFQGTKKPTQSYRKLPFLDPRVFGTDACTSSRVKECKVPSRTFTVLKDERTSSHSRREP